MMSKPFHLHPVPVLDCGKTDSAKWISYIMLLVLLLLHAEVIVQNLRYCSVIENLQEGTYKSIFELGIRLLSGSEDTSLLTTCEKLILN
jgi:hypothetical protein